MRALLLAALALAAALLWARWPRPEGLAALEGAYLGQRAFLIGNGPSLSRTPLHLIAGAGEHALAVNRWYLMHPRTPLRPSLYACIDSVVCPSLAAEIAREMDPVADAVLFPERHKDVDYRAAMRAPGAAEEKRFYFGFDEVLGTSGVGADGRVYVATTGTVASAALELLVFLGFRDVVLVGVDMEYGRARGMADGAAVGAPLVGTADDDVDHFDPAYFGAGRPFKVPNVDSVMMPGLLKAAEIARDRGATVRNAGVGGALPEDVFPRVDLRALLGRPALADEVAMLGLGWPPAPPGARALHEAAPAGTPLVTSPGSLEGLREAVVAAGAVTADMHRTHYLMGPVGEEEPEYWAVAR